jgi:hypothetical protein
MKLFFLLKWGSHPRDVYNLFIQQRLSKGLPTIIQTEATKKGVKAPPN